MSSNGPFGFDPDDFDRVIREAGEGLRDAIGKVFDMTGERQGWSVLFDEFSRRQRHEPETTGETGDGVWAIYTVDADGKAHVEEVYAAELDALRANKNNTDPTRKVRFLPYGIAASVLDGSPEIDGTPEHSRPAGIVNGSTVPFLGSGNGEEQPHHPGRGGSDRDGVRPVRFRGGHPGRGRRATHRSGQGHDDDPDLHRHRRRRDGVLRPEPCAVARRE